MVLNALVYISNELASALRCYVGYSGKIPGSLLPKEWPVPPKVMDCKEWHDVQENAKKDEIKEEELKAKQMMDGDEKDCQLEKVENLKKKTYCKDDCLYCASISIEQIGYKLSAFTCAGKNYMESIKNPPHNACRDLEPDDIEIGLPCSLETSITPISRFELLNRQSPKDFPSGGKVCTCSSDGCEPPKLSGNPNPADPANPSNPNPANPNPNPGPPNSDPNSPNPNPNAPKPNPSNTNENTGTTDKNYSDPTTQPCILSLLFIIASFLSIRF